MFKIVFVRYNNVCNIRNRMNSDTGRFVKTFESIDEIAKYINGLPSYFDKSRKKVTIDWDKSDKLTLEQKRSLLRKLFAMNKGYKVI